MGVGCKLLIYFLGLRYFQGGVWEIFGGGGWKFIFFLGGGVEKFSGGVENFFFFWGGGGWKKIFGGGGWEIFVGGLRNKRVVEKFQGG